MKKVIITGATSMIGLSIIRNMLLDNIEITAILRKNSSRKIHVPESRFITLIEASLEELRTLKITEKHDAFFHLAWSGTSPAERNVPAVQEKNIRYTLDAVNLAALAGCNTFIGAGSQAEYGKCSEKLSPQTLVNPETAYGIAKYAAGKLSEIACASKGIRHIWTRILSVYGPYDGEGTLISGIIDALSKNLPFPTTAGDQIWDYLHADDAARFIIKLAINPSAKGIYPVGSGIGLPLKHYLDEIEKITDRVNLIKKGAIPYSENTIMHLCADMHETEKASGYKPQIDFSNGIKDLWERKCSNKV